MRNDYPTDMELNRIRAWPHEDFAGLWEFARGLWWAAEWGWNGLESGAMPEFAHEEPLAALSTGGWSGNEELIEALRDNLPFWSEHWLSSRRGGHYVFRVPRPK